jgi:hypothetical protein
VVAAKEEMDRNPRSRSAKLRAVERTGERLSKSDAVSPIG